MLGTKKFKLVLFILDLFEHFILIFLHSLPLKALEMISLSKITPHWLILSYTVSRCRVRLHVNWVKTERDSMSAESTWEFCNIYIYKIGFTFIFTIAILICTDQSTWSCTLLWRGPCTCIPSALAPMTGNETPSQLCHCRMIEICDYLSELKNRIKVTESLFFCLLRFDKGKKPRT